MHEILVIGIGSIVPPQQFPVRFGGATVEPSSSSESKAIVKIEDS
jgi:hypothetical protein